MSDRGTNWSVTINNPTPDDEEAIALARQKGWKVEGQLEAGKEGTPHYQLHVKTPQIRFAALKKAFPRAHIEPARNVKALETYVKKDETRIGGLATSSEMYPSQSKFWELVCDRIQPPKGSQCMNPGRLLDQLDDACRLLIEEGYHIENIAANPSTRAIWNRFSFSIQKRTETEKTARQQSIAAAAEAAEKISVPIIPDADEEEVRSQEDAEDASSSCSEDSFSSSEYT